MTYTYEEAKKYFAECIFTSNAIEMNWYRFGFKFIEENGLCEYENDIQKLMIYKRIYGLVAMFFGFHNAYAHDDKDINDYLYFNSDELVGRLDELELLEYFGITAKQAAKLSDEDFIRLITHDKTFVQVFYRLLRSKYSFNQIYNLLNYICTDEYPDYCYENYANTPAARKVAFGDINRLLSAPLPDVIDLRDNSNSRIWLYKFEFDM